MTLCDNIMMHLIVMTTFLVVKFMKECLFYFMSIKDIVLAGSVLLCKPFDPI